MEEEFSIPLKSKSKSKWVYFLTTGIIIVAIMIAVMLIIIINNNQKDNNILDKKEDSSYNDNGDNIDNKDDDSQNINDSLNDTLTDIIESNNSTTLTGGGGGGSSDGSSDSSSSSGLQSPLSIQFYNPTPSNNSNQAQAIINATTSYSGSHYSFLDWNNSVVGWWRFESNISDEKNNLNGSVIGNTSYVSGKFGNAFYFDGNISYIQVNDSSLMDLDSFSVSFWIYKENSNAEKIFTKGEFDFYYVASSRWQLKTGDGTRNMYLYASDSDIANEWIHIVTGYDAEEDEPFIYVNGERTYQIYGIYEMEYYNFTGDLYIGTNDYTSGYDTMQGIIDEFIVFNRVLKDQEIKALYNSTNNKLEADFSGDEGLINFKAYGVDSSANVNSTELRIVNFSRNLEIPSITMVNPYNNSKYGNNYTSVSWITNSSIASNFSCQIIDNSVIVKNVTSYNNHRNSTIVFNLGDGNHLLNVSCTDSLNNTGYSETHTFFINTTNQVINISSPSGIVWNESDTIMFNASVSGIEDKYSFINWNRSLVGWFRAEDNTFDESGRGNDCYIEGNVTYSSAKFGKAFNLTEADSFIRCLDRNHEDFRFTENKSFTLSAWVYKNDNRSHSGYIIDKGCGRPYYSLLYSATRYQINVGDGTLTSSVYFLEDYPEDRWTHVVGVYDAEDQEVRIYVNGSLGMNASIEFPSYIDTRTDVLIGTNCYGGSDWNGSIDEVMFFNRALDDSEILALYDSKNNNLIMNVSNPQELTEYEYNIYSIQTQGLITKHNSSVLKDVPNTGPRILLSSPINQTKILNSTQRFICNVTNTNIGNQLKNITLYWNYSGTFIANETHSISGNSNGSVFQLNELDNKSIIWNCLACDNESNCAFSQANSTLVIGRTDYYVSQDGDDINPGTLALPFKTIQKCADIAIAGDTCYVRNGTYNETVIPSNSGNPEYPITFKPYQQENVTISGANEVINWSLHSGNIYKANISLAFNNYKNQIFYNDEMMLLARWPNTPYQDIMKPVMYVIESGVNLDSSYRNFTLNNSNLSQEEGFWNGSLIHLTYSPKYWSHTGVVVSSVNGSLVFYQDESSDYRYPGYGKFYLMGKLNMLDQEGEWYYDNVSSMLYLWAPGGVNPEGNVTAKAREYAFNLSGKSYINIKEFNIFSSGIISDINTHHLFINDINASYVFHYMFLDDLFTYHAHPSGIIISGHDNVINGSQIRYSSCNGVSFYGTRNTINHSEIFDVNYMGTIGGTIVSVGKRTEDVVIAHNKLHDSGRDVIYHEGAQNLKILYNDMYNTNVGLLTHDLGVIYATATDYKGTEIAYNTIHDSEYTYGGIYLDAYGWNAHIHHNLIYNMSYGMIIHGPINYTISHNTVDATSRSFTGGWFNPHTMPQYCYYLRNNIFTAGIVGINCTYMQRNLYENTDPGFNNATDLNYTLNTSSPAIDYGLDLNYTIDFLGRTIPQGAGSDLGAYECY